MRQDVFRYDLPLGESGALAEAEAPRSAGKIFIFHTLTSIVCNLHWQAFLKCLENRYLLALYNWGFWYLLDYVIEIAL